MSGETPKSNLPVRFEYVENSEGASNLRRAYDFVLKTDVATADATDNEAEEVESTVLRPSRHNAQRAEKTLE